MEHGVELVGVDLEADAVALAPPDRLGGQAVDAGEGSQSVGRTGRPRSRSSATQLWKTSSISGSSPEVGSSRMSRSTSEAKAATRATFWRFPLEYVRPFLVGSWS